jgi:hypothetical protein
MLTLSQLVISRTVAQRTRWDFWHLLQTKDLFVPIIRLVGYRVGAAILA